MQLENLATRGRRYFPVLTAPEGTTDESVELVGIAKMGVGDNGCWSCETWARLRSLGVTN